MTADLFNSRLQQQPLDGHGQTSMKKIDGLLPVFGGRLLNSGYGLDGRGGDAFSTGVELFDPQSLGPGLTNQIKSQTSAYLSRCFALKTLHSRLVWNARDGRPRQEIFAASGSIRRGLINELKDPSVGPANLDAKVFLYEVTEPAGLRDLYGFSCPSWKMTKPSRDTSCSPLQPLPHRNDTGRSSLLLQSGPEAIHRRRRVTPTQRWRSPSFGVQTSESDHFHCAGRPDILPCRTLR